MKNDMLIKLALSPEQDLVKVAKDLAIELLLKTPFTSFDELDAALCDCLKLVKEGAKIVEADRAFSKFQISLGRK